MDDPEGGGLPPPSAVRVRVDLAYDGAPFHGMARQPGLPTVQGLVEDALTTLVRAPVETVVAGRTDAGVHALGQVLSFDAPADWPYLRDPARARVALDKLCGPAITIWAVAAADDGFDARFSARYRRYCYRLCDAEAMAPLWRHDTWHVGGPLLDVGAMAEGANHLVGEHDFSSFCRRAGEQHLIRHVNRLTPERAGEGLVTIEVDGQAFCHQMVRSIVAALVRVGRGQQPPSHLATVLATRDRSSVGAIAPPHGLTLVAVDY